MLHQPSFETFGLLVVGAVSRIRDRTVTGMLQAAGLAGVWHHSRAHDFFARRRWDPDDLGLRLLEFLVTVLVKPGDPVRFAVDDTLFGRSGRRVYGTHYLHDGAQPEGSGRRTRWGNCWVVVVLVVNLPCTGGRPVGLPMLLRLFRPKDDEHPNRASQPELARLLIDKAITRLPGRTVALVMDGAYATRWRASGPRDAHDRMRQRALSSRRRDDRQARTPGAQRSAVASLARSPRPRRSQRSDHQPTAPADRARASSNASGTGRSHPADHRPVIRNPAQRRVRLALAPPTRPLRPALIAGYDSAGRSRPATKKPRPRRRRSPHRVRRPSSDRPVRVPHPDITIAWYHCTAPRQRPDRPPPRRAVVPPQTTVSYTDMLAALRREIIRADSRTNTRTTTTHKSAQPSPQPIAARDPESRDLVLPQRATPPPSMGQRPRPRDPRRQSDHRRRRDDAKPPSRPGPRPARGADTCATYLTNKAAYLDYPTASPTAGRSRPA